MHLDLLRDTAKTFPKIENKLEILGLKIWHCKYETLQPLAEFQSLEKLVIASFPDDSLDIVVSLPKLRYLRILHMPKISKLDALSSTQFIEVLSLSTSPSWDSSGKCTIVESLKPIALMPSLKYLELFGVCPVDRSLAELDGCRNLQTARFSRYANDEIERFYRLTGVENQYVSD
ncbi:hypothetical protein [Undibacterium sp. Ji49W]|uniref:hypothetical protein n=1 Tax=Undibacterium sp. Ji49W TaxID=3413040 RepID=UPI003BF2CCF2